MNIHLLSHYTPDWVPYADLVIPNMIEYCLRHNYDFHIIKSEKYPKYNGSVKILQLSYLKLGDIGFVIDIDACITNHLIKIEDFLDEEHDLYLTKDINGINTGVFILRKTDWACELLDYIDKQISSGVDCEQTAIQNWINEKGLDKIKILPHPAFNSYPIDFYYPSYGKIGYKEGDVVQRPGHEEGAWQLGDFVLHVPALPLEQRIEIISKTPIIK